MPASSLFSLCQYADTQIYLPHLHYLNLLYLCPITALGASQCLPILIQQIPCTLPSSHLLSSTASLPQPVCSAIKSCAQSLPSLHRFQSPLNPSPIRHFKDSKFNERWQALASSPVNALFSHCNHYHCFQPAASIPSGGCRDFLLFLFLFSPLLCSVCPLKPFLPREHLFEHYFVFERAQGTLWAQTPKELQLWCRDCSKGGTEQPRGPALGWAMDREMKNAGC